MSEGPPPADLATELLVLSSVLEQPAEFARVRHLLDAGAFFAPEHGALWQAAERVADAGGVVEPARVCFEAQTAAGLAGLVAAAPVVSGRRLDEAVAVVGSLRRLRAAISLCHHTAAAGYSVDPGSVPAYLDGLSRALYELQAAAPGPGALPLKEVLGDLFQRLQGPAPGGLPTYPALDEFIGGLRPGELYIVAGRPGMGKSALAGCLALRAARAGHVYHASLEMPADQVAARYVAQQTGLPLQAVRAGRLGDQWDTLVEGCRQLGELPIWVDDRGGSTVAACRGAARRVLVPQPALVVVDYLQLVEGHGESREQQVASVSRDLKALARDLQVPVVACAQLNRQVELRVDKRPTMADLRESGAIEADADVVLLLYRAGYYQEQAGQEDSTCGETDVIVGKNRNGPTGVARLQWEAAATRFVG